MIDPRQNRCVALQNCTCPQGQVKGCRSLCPRTCDNPNPTCIEPLVCNPACVCPSGTVLDPRQNRCVVFANCTCPEGKVMGCRSLCPATCANPNPTCIEPLVCTPACVCPSGTVLDSRQNRCVPRQNCSCPIRGQVMGCRSLCPATCDRPNRTCIEPLVCNPACVCPSGTVLDTRRNRCVTLQRCSCPSGFVKGCQSLCPRTCDNLNPSCIEPLICRPACVCRSGTVYDSRRNRCVAPLSCTRGNIQRNLKVHLFSLLLFIPSSLSFESSQSLLLHQPVFFLQLSWPPQCYLCSRLLWVM